MAESRLDRHGDSQSDLEEGEVESEQSSDDDYSPGSLVIDTAGGVCVLCVCECNCLQNIIQIVFTSIPQTHTPCIYMYYNRPSLV